METIETKEIYAVKTVDSRGQKKTFFNRIGVAHFQNDGTIDLSFDTFPVRNDGSIKIQIREKKEN